MSLLRNKEPQYPAAVCVCVFLSLCQCKRVSANNKEAAWRKAILLASVWEKTIITFWNNYYILHSQLSNNYWSRFYQLNLSIFCLIWNYMFHAHIGNQNYCLKEYFGKKHFSKPKSFICKDIPKTSNHPHKLPGFGL